ncbi:MAG: c-type cytochrome [Quisquiliibacterium sp.]
MRRNLGRITLALAAVGLILVVTLWLLPRAPDQVAPLASASSSDLALGGQLYRQHCASCHGEQLQGQPEWRRRKPDGRLPAPPHDDSGHTWHHPDSVLLAMVRNGLQPPNAPPGYQSDMPAYAGVLDDRQIWAVLAYIASQWTQKAREHQARISRQQTQAR